MPDTQPITIKRGSFMVTLYDIDRLMELPVANIRKLWAIMFDAAYENTATISTIREWLPAAIASTKSGIDRARFRLAGAKADAETKRRAAACMGDGYWAKQVADIRTALKRARTEVLQEGLAHRLEKAIEQRDAPKIAARAAKNAEKDVRTALADHAKANSMQSIFTEMYAKAKI